jgi:hypothetical protein
VLRSANPIADMRVDAHEHAELSNQARLVHSTKVTRQRHQNVVDMWRAAVGLPQEPMGR